MFENKSNVNLHRHPSSDGSWFEIRYDVEECIIGIDGDWTAHVNKVILDFSGYRREFDLSTCFEIHRKHSSKGTPDIDVHSEALIATSGGLLATWNKGGMERAQLSNDLIYWSNIPIIEASQLLKADSIETHANYSLSDGIKKHCQTNGITFADSVNQIAPTSHRILEQFIKEQSSQWQLSTIASGFKTVSQYGITRFTITPLDIVYWQAPGLPEIISEHQAIARMRSFSFFEN